mgnify:CR=1 FL=1
MIRQIQVGDVPVGGGAPVSIQSMLNTKTTDVEGSLRQLEALKAAGCQIARLAVPNEEAARGFREIAAQSPLPLVADIHFDYKLAIAAAEGGAAKIRINPGNIGGEDRVQAVVEVCKSKHIPIRIGVNGGSLDKKLLEKYGHPTAEALVESAFSHLELLEKQGFYDTCVSMKSSTVPVMVAACRLFRQRCDYPLHIGVTETGPVRMGMIKSAMGIGALLLEKFVQLGFILELMGAVCPHAVIWLGNDGPADSFGESLGLRYICRHTPAGGGDTGFLVVGFHHGFALELFDLSGFNAGGNIKICPQAGILFQPIFIVAFYPVDLAILESEKAHGAQHFIIVFHVVHTVILGQCAFEQGGQRFVRGIANAKHIYAIGTQAVTKIPVIFREMR